METKIVTVRLPVDLLGEAKEAIEASGETFTAFVIKAVRLYLEKPTDAAKPVIRNTKKESNTAPCNTETLPIKLDAVSTGHGKISLPVTVSSPEEAGKVARSMRTKAPAPLLKYVAPTRDNLPGPRRSSKGKPEPVKQSSGMIQRRELPDDSTAHEEYRAKAERLKRLATLTAEEQTRPTEDWEKEPGIFIKCPHDRNKLRCGHTVCKGETDSRR